MNKNHIGLLIDAENMSYRYIEKIMEKINSYVIAENEKNPELETRLTHKLAFANWYEHTTDDWLAVLKTNGIKQKHSSSHSVGKNASDISLVIYTMDAVFSKGIDTFIIATCDSDFTELAYKLTEYGKKVIICGNKTTSTSLKNSGQDYWEVDICSGKPERLTQKDLKSPKDYHISLTSATEAKTDLKDKTELSNLAKHVYNQAVLNTGEKRVDMSYIYAEMRKVAQTSNRIVDYKKQRFGKLKPFIESLKVFKFSSQDKGSTVTYFVELKTNKPARNKKPQTTNQKQ